ncbi:1-acyl-sn-glycerol-3-phosphate acyltransferase delta [Parasteatoda tepidariorum]|uniref:1-acyl-sn-glycerol-3-phosphate acyltransferase delta n=1 Tax=Parasteatoda tepidariorum TaxID=114398 RepID=UPI00077F9143|nr:1-acyl-sn-glycerol-3-phosphate acyltransferase delta [Parasteatoda tepidariorum]
MSAAKIGMRFARVVGRFLFASFMAIAFVFSGIIINFLQFLLYITLFNRFRNFYRKINYYLIYTTWAQVVAFAQWWSGSRVRKWGAEEDIKKFGTEHCLVIMNHKYDTDWLYCWMTCEDLGMLANAKSCAKKSLMKIPVIGWGWIFGEMIFLERSWEKDKVTLGPKLDNLVSYEDPIMILYFCEGTRFTPEKHQASLEFARANNLPILEHHLSPRTRGFNFTVKHLKTKIAAVYDVQLAFPDGPVKPTFANMLKGNSFNGDIHIKRYPMSEIPTDSDEASSKWLHNLYVEKDRLMDNYFKTQRFPGVCIKVKPRIFPLLNVIFWSAVVGVPFCRLLLYILVNGSLFAISAVVSIAMLFFTIMYYMVRATSSAKGSSYGKDKSPKRINNGSVSHESANGSANSISDIPVSESSETDSIGNENSDTVESNS